MRDAIYAACLLSFPSCSSASSALYTDSIDRLPKPATPAAAGVGMGRTTGLGALRLSALLTLTRRGKGRPAHGEYDLMWSSRLVVSLQ